MGMRERISDGEVNTTNLYMGQCGELFILIQNFIFSAKN